MQESEIDAIVVPLRQRVPDAVKRAELWESIVRFMEANGKRTFEIGLDDAREIATIMRGAADGRE